MTDGGLNATPRRWSRARWGGYVGTIFAVQLLLVFLLSLRPPLATPAIKAPGRLQLVTDPLSEQALIRQPWLEDPAQFALASPRGFSGGAWLDLPRFEPDVLQWSDPPRWLTQDVSQLAQTPGTLSETAREPLPRVQPPSPILPLNSALRRPLQTNSVLRVEGELAQRRRLATPDLPSWEHNDVLLPSVVQVLVDEQGTVLSATLLTRSGLAAADERALALARDARFEAARAGVRSQLFWGRLVFQWHAIEPAPVPPASSTAKP